MRTLLVTLLLSLSLLTGCVTGEKVRQHLVYGMTQDEVVRVLGRPDAYYRKEGGEVFVYSNRLMSGWSWNTTSYNVIFREGRVVSYGHGAVSDNDTPIRQAFLEAQGARYYGNCPCPYSRAADGSRCGTRSAWSRSGGADPICY